MKREIGIFQLFGFGVTSLLGTILHFLYDWCGKSVIVAPISGVNESTWEHMKLIFWPMFIYSIAEYFFFRDRKNFWCIKLRGMLLGLGLIPLIFYAYNGIIGKSPDWFNISIFFISAAAAYLYETHAFNKKSTPCYCPRIAFIMLLVIAAAFIVFTFYAPDLNIFKDPEVAGAFGRN